MNWLLKARGDRRGSLRDEALTTGHEHLDHEMLVVTEAILKGVKRGRLDRSDACVLLDPLGIYELCSDRHLSPAAHVISRRYGLQFSSMEVGFSDARWDDGRMSGSRAGLAEISDTWEGVSARVSIHARFRQNPHLIAAVVCHELGHVLLTLIDDLFPEPPSEIQTDLAMFVCGMGKLPLNTLNRAFHVGYLSREEMIHAYYQACVYSAVPFEEAHAGLDRHAARALTRYRRAWCRQLGGSLAP